MTLQINPTLHKATSIHHLQSISAADLPLAYIITVQGKYLTLVPAELGKAFRQQYLRLVHLLSLLGKQLTPQHH